MKLAEALQERADLLRRIEQLRTRLDNNVLVQEGETPAENPDQLLEELERCIARSEELMTRINLTNAAVTVEGESLTALLARRDCLKMKLSLWHDAVNTASQTARRATRSEIRIRSAIDVPALQKRVDGVSKLLRETDNLIQAANWLNDLI
ncbi:MAG: DIP1984 family protein [Aristaeellaceae bacterium]